MDKKKEDTPWWMVLLGIIMIIGFFAGVIWFMFWMSHRNETSE